MRDTWTSPRSTTTTRTKTTRTTKEKEKTKIGHDGGTAYLVLYSENIEGGLRQHQADKLTCATASGYATLKAKRPHEASAN
eukprot:1474873-Pyramimonas_sp.AAC.1